MKRKLITLAAFLLVGCLANVINAQSPELTGSWEIDSVQIKTTINGRITTKMYGMKDDFTSFIPCPSQIVFNGNNVSFEYKDGHKSEGTYKRTSSKKMEIMFPVAGFDYDYQFLNEDLFRLDFKVDYLIDGEKSAQEEYKYYGHRE